VLVLRNMDSPTKGFRSHPRLPLISGMLGFNRRSRKAPIHPYAGLIRVPNFYPIYRNLQAKFINLHAVLPLLRYSRM